MPYDEYDNIGDEELAEEYDGDGDWDRQPLWQVALPIIVALVVGAIVGLVLGAQFFGSAKAAGNVNSDAVLVLASDLYHQGESIQVVQEHLTALGYNNAAPALFKLADEYAASNDTLKKRQSSDLRELGEAVLLANGTTVTPSVLAPTALPTTPTVQLQTPTATKSAANTPTPTQSDSTPTLTVTAATATKTAATPTTTIETVDTPTGGTADIGRITSSDGYGAKMRKAPDVDSAIVAYLTNGMQVQILDIVNGEAIDETEPRWYKVQYNSAVGYIYYKLVIPGG